MVSSFLIASLIIIYKTTTGYGMLVNFHIYVETLKIKSINLQKIMVRRMS